MTEWSIDFAGMVLMGLTAGATTFLTLGAFTVLNGWKACVVPPVFFFLGMGLYMFLGRLSNK